MLKNCVQCGKGAMVGMAVSRKGLAKKKGGTGSKVCRRNKRSFDANLQKMRIIVDKHPKTVYICTKCIKKGTIKRA
ncbi:MAG TPA: 50S ribosomal protein L28 [Candidatus Omnitrophota bacterium]|nr:50S ribosomal protein L28 [Candidatus Omnitrophota bacterium]HPT06724.1 50S ribosomal protein L28 [Candidatus Omnitrophota bacterium]